MFKKFLGVCVAAILLNGCVSLGMSQADSETGYTVAAIGSDVFILSGKATPEAIGQICLADNASYKVLAATRNVADGVSYAPADAAHATLQKDGARLAPVQCIPI